MPYFPLFKSDYILNKYIACEVLLDVSRKYKVHYVNAELSVFGCLDSWMSEGGHDDKWRMKELRKL